jgi:hypothetical protein
MAYLLGFEGLRWRCLLKTWGRVELIKMKERAEGARGSDIMGGCQPYANWKHYFNDDLVLGWALRVLT